MITIYICPDCGCEHGEPAAADYLLKARCFDCALVLELVDFRFVRDSHATDVARRTAA